MGDTHWFWNTVSKELCVKSVSGLVWQLRCDLETDPASWPQVELWMSTKFLFL